MSKKQMQKLILIIVLAVVIVGGIFTALFFIDFDSLGGSVDIEKVKAEGGYEQFKTDVLSIGGFRDSQVSKIADIFFEDIGVKKYESVTQGGRKGTLTIVCDGYNFDTTIIAGECANAYIGNILVYKNDRVTSSIPSNVTTYTYSQYKTFVNTVKRGFGISEEKAKNMYETFSLLDITTFTNIKKGKLGGVSGYYGYEGNMPYFAVITSEEELDKLYIVCDGFKPIEVYDKGTAKGNETTTTYKVISGSRTTLPDSLNFKIANYLGDGRTVVLPATLLTGDDSWLIVKNNGEIYIEVDGEVVNGEKRNTEKFIIKITEEDRDIIYLKVGKKIYVEG